MEWSGIGIDKMEKSERRGIYINTVVFQQDGNLLIALIEPFSTLGGTSLGTC